MLSRWARSTVVWLDDTGWTFMTQALKTCSAITRVTVFTHHWATQDLVWPDYTLAWALRTLAGSMARDGGTTLDWLSFAMSLEDYGTSSVSTSPGLTFTTWDDMITLDC